MPKFAYEQTTAGFLEAVAAMDGDALALDDIEGFRSSASRLQLEHTCNVPDGVDIENREIESRDGSIPIRIYRRHGESQLAPVLVYFHGGAWVIGGLDECDGVCASLCRYGGVSVVSVDYRLAPEHKFPAAVLDSIDAVLWAVKNAESIGGLAGKLGVAGDSAGGNLAAVVCQQLKSMDKPIVSRQVLIYPCLAPRDPEKYPSRELFGGDDCFLNESGFRHLLELYRRSSEDELDTRLWPALESGLGNLPDTYIVTAEFDMLRDEAREYGRALTASGNSVTYRCYKGTIHGFFCFSGTIEPGRQALYDLCEYLQGW